jgi:hypothetical protein
MVIDLAAAILPDLEMPPGFALTNGAYLPVSRCVWLDGDAIPEGAIARAYEATYEEHLGESFAALQLIAWASDAAPIRAVAIANGLIERMRVKAEQVDGEVSSVAGIARLADDLDEAIAVDSAVMTSDYVTVRVIFCGPLDRVSPAGLRETNRVIRSIGARIRQLVAGEAPSGMLLHLPQLAPVFDPEANFENYLFRPSRYEAAAVYSTEFVSGYRRGLTEQWAPRGRRRRLLASDMLAFRSDEGALGAISEPGVLLSSVALRDGVRQEVSGASTIVIASAQQSSGAWKSTVFRRFRDLIVTGDVWGYERREDGETIAVTIADRVVESIQPGSGPAVIGPDVYWGF